MAFADIIQMCSLWHSNGKVLAYVSRSLQESSFVCHYFKGINTVICKQASGLSVNPWQNIRVTDKEFSLQQNGISHGS